MDGQTKSLTLFLGELRGGHLAGQQVVADILFDDDDKVIKQNVTNVPPLSVLRALAH